MAELTQIMAELLVGDNISAIGCLGSAKIYETLDLIDRIKAAFPMLIDRLIVCMWEELGIQASREGSHSFSFLIGDCQYYLFSFNHETNYSFHHESYKTVISLLPPDGKASYDHSTPNECILRAIYGTDPNPEYPETMKSIKQYIEQLKIMIQSAISNDLHGKYIMNDDKYQPIDIEINIDPERR